MVGKKVKKYAAEKETMDEQLKSKEAEALESAAEISELHATIARLRSEGVDRERKMSELDKKLLAMHSSMQRLESNKQLLELRVKELEDIHEPTMVQLMDVTMTSNRLEAELLAEGERRASAESQVGEHAAKIQRLQKDLHLAEQHAKDAEFHHVTTIAKLFTHIAERAQWTTLAEFARERDAQLKEDQSRAGRPRVERTATQLSDEVSPSRPSPEIASDRF